MVAENDVPSSAADTPSFTIEQVAAQTGLTKRTLRYYEEVGLLPPTGRTEGNYRRYTPDDIQHLERIKNLRNLLGFSLSDIREILLAEDERKQIGAAYREETELATKISQIDHIDEILRSQLQLIEQKIAGLEQMRTTLLTKRENLERKRQDLQQSLESQENT